MKKSIDPNRLRPTYGQLHRHKRSLMFVALIATAVTAFGLRLGILREATPTKSAGHALDPYEPPMLHMLGNLFINEAFAQEGLSSEGGGESEEDGGTSGK